MRKPRLYSHNVMVLALMAISILVLISTCYAQADTGPHVYVPEAGSIALVSTSGFFGYLIRFARKRFKKFKRCFDVVVSVLALLLAFPIMLVTAIFIKAVSKGPVLFKQQRVGLNGKLFEMYKLRTMEIDAEKETGPVWAKEDDPRLISFGGFLRKTHIDEFPQFFNVLKGEMSIIGPRPERPPFVDYLSQQIGDYKKRLKVKPGITGLAQVRHKYDETVRDVKRKVKLDLLYIRRMCLWVDMQILAMTFVAVLTGKGSR